ncbi:MAG: hypothetical protein ACM3IJ_00370 [Candidatus Levyibacteriota bacterium]
MKALLKLLKNKESVFSAIIYSLLFLYLIYPYRDYDWGWHYRYGEYFVKTGHIMSSDVWTWSMRGYQWVNHEWLYDPLLYILFSLGSFWAMTLAGAIVGFIPFVLLLSLYKLSYWQKGILAFFYMQLTSGVYWQGLRSQMIGNLLLAVYLYFLIKLYHLLLEKYRDKKFSFKVHYPLLILPPLFFLWANLHASFTMGLLLFAIFLGSSLLVLFVKNRNQEDKERGFYVPLIFIWSLGSFFASFALTFVNPFTYHVYIEAIKHTTSFLLPYITEWTPAGRDSFFFFVFMIFSILLLVGTLIRRKLSDLPLCITALIFFWLAWGARRYNADYVTLALPLGAVALQSFKVKLERFKATAFVSVIFLSIAAEVVLFQNLPSYHLWGYSFKDYCDQGSSCSENLTAYLLKHPPKGDGFNLYDWGGYLIGRGVQARLFIDGRMHLWEGPNHYYPFLQYQKMYYGADFKRFNYYNFDWFIGSTDSILGQILQKTPGWNVAYKDDRAVYIVRVRESELKSKK